MYICLLGIYCALRQPQYLWYNIHSLTGPSVLGYTSGKKLSIVQNVKDCVREEFGYLRSVPVADARHQKAGRSSRSRVFPRGRRRRVGKAHDVTRNRTHSAPHRPTGRPQIQKYSLPPVLHSAFLKYTRADGSGKRLEPPVMRFYTTRKIPD